MAFFNNKMHTLEQLEELYWEMEAPKFFSFCGILDSIKVIDEGHHVVSFIDHSIENRITWVIKNQIAVHLGSRIKLLIKYTNPGCVNQPVLDVGDSVFDVKTTMVYFPCLELKYIENDDFVCGFLDDEKQKPVKINGQTTMIRPNRIAIALETDPQGLQDLLLQDQVSLSI